MFSSQEGDQLLDDEGESRNLYDRSIYLENRDGHSLELFFRMAEPRAQKAQTGNKELPVLCQRVCRGSRKFFRSVASKLQADPIARLCVAWLLCEQADGCCIPECHFCSLEDFVVSCTRSCGPSKLLSRTLLHSNGQTGTGCTA